MRSRQRQRKQSVFLSSSDQVWWLWYNRLIYWDQLVLSYHSNLMNIKNSVVVSVPTFTDSDIPQPRPWVRPVFLPVSIHLSGTWTPWLYHEHTLDHPANAWIHGFILHNCNGLCEMTWVVWGCGARLSWPKCFLFFLLYFMCVYPRRSVLC